MRLIAHVSDVHFGHEDAVVVAGLLQELQQRAPHLVVVSGDLTQRARPREFAGARAFLDRLPSPRLVVPGNHDIPLFDVMRRWLDPRGRYVRHVSADLQPMYSDPELAVLGLDTTRAYRWREGEISAAQVEAIRTRLGAAEQHAFKVLVVHHPFVPAPNEPRTTLVGNVGAALRAAEDSGVDLVLSGHLHQGYVSDMRTTHRQLRRGILSGQAGTAVSRRRRLEANTYNLITVDGTALAFEVRVWDGREFVRRDVRRFAESADGWSEV
jgi:3',5'-cyclic AMP phosphodiesterase CpdA